MAYFPRKLSSLLCRHDEGESFQKKKIQKNTCVDIMTFSNKVPGYLCSKRSCNVNCFVNVWGVGKNYPLLEIANMTFLVSYPVAILSKGTSDLMQG